ncbi:MAG: hypothetical protein DI527_23545 [Chelatococcus sp.]|nr:MAG: hypothetical protein DI527_23545 [Chelatococcus sp.]
MTPLPLRERVGVRGRATFVAIASHCRQGFRPARPLIRPFGPPSPARGEGDALPFQRRAPSRRASRKPSP